MKLKSSPQCVLKSLVSEWWWLGGGTGESVSLGPVCRVSYEGGRDTVTDGYGMRN